MPEISGIDLILNLKKKPGQLNPNMAKRTLPLSLSLFNHKPWTGSESKWTVYFPITLCSGRIVYLEEISIGTTYSNLVNEKPNFAINQRILENLKRLPFTYVIPPDEKLVADILPLFKIKTSLFSTPINPMFDGSALLLMWLGNFNIDKTLKDNFEDIIKKIEWEKHAQDFTL